MSLVVLFVRRRLSRDRRAEPRVGERVPYVVVYGSPGLPLIQLVRRYPYIYVVYIYFLQVRLTGIIFFFRWQCNSRQLVLFYLCVYVLVCLFTCLLVCLFVCLFACLLVCLFACLLVYLFTCLLVYLFTRLYLFLFIYLFNIIPTFLFIFFSRSLEEVLNDPSLRLNAVYYINKQIIPPLNRAFGLIGIDVSTWLVMELGFFCSNQII